MAGLLSSVAGAQKLDATIVNRHISNRGYNFSPYAGAAHRGSGPCGVLGSGSCSYRLTGATLSLELPDGRLAIVNCVDRFAEHFAGPGGNRRSCRIPMGDRVQADFKGKTVRVAWVVSLDGHKKDSETYEVVGMLAAPLGAPSPPAQP